MKWQPKTRKHKQRLYGDALNTIARFQRSKYVCFKCRKKWSSPWSKIHPWMSGMEKCPQCGGKLTCVGTIFKAPRKRNKLAWRWLEETHSATK